MAQAYSVQVRSHQMTTPLRKDRTGGPPDSFAIVSRLAGRARCGREGIEQDAERHGHPDSVMFTAEICVSAAKVPASTMPAAVITRQ